jgi:phospholipid transport system substrate-binding protein
MASGSAANAVKTLRRGAARCSRARLWRVVDGLMGELQMIQRSLLLSAFVLLSSIIGGTQRSLAATDDPASVVGDLGTRAIAAIRNGDTAAVQGRFRQLFRQYFDAEACARSALGPYWQNATAQQRQEYANRYEDYIIIVYSTLLGHLGGESFTVLGSRASEEGVIVTSRVNGIVSIGVDWLLNPTNNGYKVTNLFVGGIDMASMQRSDLVSVVQRNSGQVQALLVALREKNASNGILRY